MKEIIGTIVYIAVICLVVFLILHYVGQRTVVRGDSMDNTLRDGQNLIMDKISYRFHDPERFDIVIFPGPEENGEHPYYIKRVIGLPGENVQIKNGVVYIDGEELTEDVYGITACIDEPGIAREPLTLGEDEYFCLGDNRPVSYDSRYEEVGPVERSEIIGKVWIRIWPISLFGTVE
ncbi:MAG: signal peptidase I [Anaerobutyricum sp.]|nr:signal peptidase I [Lachnospiraceae bacterium]MDY6047210.1 signal peptidase I [Anaerobutyricum sp.]